MPFTEPRMKPTNNAMITAMPSSIPMDPATTGIMETIQEMTIYAMYMAMAINIRPMISGMVPCFRISLWTMHLLAWHQTGRQVE